MAKIMDEATRRKLSGLLPFAPGSFARFTPPEFDVVAEEFRPWFNIREGSRESLKKYRERNKEGDNALLAFIEFLQDGALGGWGNYPDMGSGEPFEFSKENIAYLPESLIVILFLRVMEFTNGPSEEEKTGLESLPPPTVAQ